MRYLCDYDPDWPQWFQRIEHYLRPRLTHVLRIEHIGSTSVVGMVAKPIIDLDVVVPEGAMSSAIASIEQAGYRHQGNLGLIGREAFEPVSEFTRSLPPHHLYACETSAFELRKHLSFRDYLRAHPLEAERLSDFKRQLADERKLGRGEYVQAKSESSFVHDLSIAALSWYDNQHGA